MNLSELLSPEMYESDWGSLDRRLSRKFRLEIRLSQFTPLARQVLNALENDVLKVFRPDDEDAFAECIESGGSIPINQRADFPVKIKEWLPVGCQWIGFDPLDQNKRALACYEHNAPKVIFPIGDRTPIGPSAFLAEIKIADRALPKGDAQEQIDAFSFVLAHELVHVFDMMRFMVPAFLDWRSFQRCALHSESRRERALWLFQAKALFLDDYGSENEKAMVAEYWPSYADKWFDACTRVYRALKP